MKGNCSYNRADVIFFNFISLIPGIEDVGLMLTCSKSV